MKLVPKGLTILLLLVLLALCSGVRPCDATRSGKHWRRSRAPSTSLLRGKGKARSSSYHKPKGKGNQSPSQPSPSTSPATPVSPSGSPAQGKGGRAPTTPAPSDGSGYTLPSVPLQPPPTAPAAPSQGTVFNVVDFGAKGDGIADDTQVTITAFENAVSSSDIFVTLMQALRFYGSSNVTVTGITIVNSSQCHLKFDSCQGVMVHDITISSPENSPNTDGIHRNTAEAADSAAVPPVQPLLLASLWRALHPHHSSHTLPADGQASREQRAVRRRPLLTG